MHHLSAKLTNHYDLIAVESIPTKELITKRNNNMNILDASWGEFLSMLEYKSQEKGVHLVKVDRFYPSSQICANCGSKQIMPVHLRTFQCRECKTSIDRDFNAAKNMVRKFTSGKQAPVEPNPKYW